MGKYFILIGLSQWEFRMLCAVYRSPRIVGIVKSRMLQLAGLVAGMWETVNSYRIVVGQSVGKWPLGR
jgi:hypothetical protein